MNKMRLLFLEEVDCAELDANRLKNLTGGADSETVDMMYGTQLSIKQTGKFIFLSNHNPNFKNDEGMTRRLLVENLMNKFVFENELNNIFLPKPKQVFVCARRAVERKFSP